MRIRRTTNQKVITYREPSLEIPEVNADELLVKMKVGYVNTAHSKKKNRIAKMISAKSEKTVCDEYENDSCQNFL